MDFNTFNLTVDVNDDGKYTNIEDAQGWVLKSISTDLLTESLQYSHAYRKKGVDIITAEVMRRTETNIRSDDMNAGCKQEAEYCHETCTHTEYVARLRELRRELDLFKAMSRRRHRRAFF
jgi:hypothetical protein